ncbi:MAG: hypothetical protein RR536_01720 [Anaerovoracaceae bacterium]
MDYSACAFPKPKDKKKSKKVNGYKDKSKRICYYTGEAGAERHEVYGGPNRQISIDHGFQVDLYQEIHERFHNPETKEDFERIKFWKQKYQKEYEQKVIDSGVPKAEARRLWILMIGRNYLEDEN